MHRRTLLLGLWGLSLVAGCGGATSTLHALGEPKGSGPIDFQVENRTDATINNLYLAKTSDVRAAPEAAFATGSPEQAKLWGQDQLPGSALEPGGRARVPISDAGRYDVRVVDRDGREQHVAGLQVRAGGRYVLELNEGSWRRPR